MRALLLALLLVAGAAIADDTVTVVLPTEYDNGDPLPVSQISRWTVFWGTAENSYQTGALSVQASQLSVTVPRSGPGKVCYVVVVADMDGIESDQSEPICRTVRKPKPARIQSVR